MHPYVALKIKNHIPQIVYYPEEGSEKILTLQEESIYEAIIPIAKKLDLIDRELVENDSEILPELLDLARQSDELFLDELPEIQSDNLEFDLDLVLNTLLEEILEEQKSQYDDSEMSDEVRAQINMNLNADIFAGLLEIMYMTLIAKTVLAASELGIGTIKLDDDGKNARLMEKMAIELERLGVEMIVDESEYSYDD